MHYELATRIRRIRQFRGFKQEAVARELGISQQAYSSIELGRDVRVGTLIKICEVLRIDPAMLVTPKVQITEDSMNDFEDSSVFDLVTENKKLRHTIEVYQNILQPRRA